MRRASWLVLIFLLHSTAFIYRAQSPGDTTDAKAENGPDGSSNIAQKETKWRFEMGSSEWGVQPGYAPMQPTFFSGHKEYDTDGRKFAVVSLRYGHIIGTVRGVTYEYLFESAPYAVAINNEVGDKNSVKPKVEDRRANSLGITIQPAGFRFVFMPEHRLKPFAQTAAGFIFSRHAIPIPQGTNYNFVGDFGGGAMFSLTPRQVLKAGYRYYHISNMNLGQLNPGYNANMFYIEMSVFSK